MRNDIVLLLAVVGVLVVGCDSTVSGTATGVTGTSPSSEATPSRDPGGAHAEVGDCVNMFPRGDGAYATEIDCAAPDATYEVGYRRDGTTGTCPTESYDQYTQTGPDGDFMLCLMMNGEVGECFDGYSAPDEWKAKVDCADADVVVSVRLDDRVDPAACPPTSGWQLIYPQTQRTICLDRRA
jgi:hypothetical protein